MPTNPAFRGLVANVGPRSLIEQATGALMLEHGIDAHQALAMLVGWARGSRTPVPTVALRLLRGICELDPQASGSTSPLRTGP